MELLNKHNVIMKVKKNESLQKKTVLFKDRQHTDPSAERPEKPPGLHQRAPAAGDACAVPSLAAQYTKPKRKRHTRQSRLRNSRAGARISGLGLQTG